MRRRSSAELPAIHDDAHSSVAVHGSKLHRHACAWLFRESLIVDAPARLLERRRAIGGGLQPSMLARCSDAQHPVPQAPRRNGHSEPSFQLAPGGFGFERASVAGLHAQLWILGAALQLQANAADADGTADLDFRA